MAGSVNKVILVGNLGKDPEIRTLQSGSKIANLSVATSETWNDRGSGERKERTEWHRVVIFNEKIAEVAERYLKKGAKVYLEGTLETRKYTDQSGAPAKCSGVSADWLRPPQRNEDLSTSTIRSTRSWRLPDTSSRGIEFRSRPHSIPLFR